MKKFKKIATPQWFYFIVIQNMLMYLKSTLVLFVLVSLATLPMSSVYGQVTVTDGATYVENQFIGNPIILTEKLNPIHYWMTLLKK